VVKRARKCPTAKGGSYRTEEAAKIDLALIRSRSDREVKPIRVYCCNFCHQWHLTSQPLRKTKRNP
jgi:hypothetical protein